MVSMLRRAFEREGVFRREGLLRREEGVTAIEYALVAGLVALSIIAGVTALGTRLSDIFSHVTTEV